MSPPLPPSKVHCFSEEMNDHLAPRLSFLYTSMGTTVKFYPKVHVSCIVLHILPILLQDLFISCSLSATGTAQQYKLFLNNAKLFSKFKISWYHYCRIVNAVYLFSWLVEARYLCKKSLKTCHIRILEWSEMMRNEYWWFLEFPSNFWQLGLSYFVLFGGWLYENLSKLLSLF